MSASSVPRRTGSAIAASTSGSGSRASCATSAAWKSPGRRSVASEWVTSNSRRPSVISGISREHRAVLVSCWISLPEISKRFCTSRPTSRFPWTPRRASELLRASKLRLPSVQRRLTLRRPSSRGSSKRRSRPSLIAWMPRSISVLRSSPWVWLRWQVVQRVTRSMRRPSHRVHWVAHNWRMRSGGSIPRQTARRNASARLPMPKSMRSLAR